MQRSLVKFREVGYFVCHHLRNLPHLRRGRKGGRIKTKRRQLSRLGASRLVRRGTSIFLRRHVHSRQWRRLHWADRRLGLTWMLRHLALLLKQSGLQLLLLGLLHLIGGLQRPRWARLKRMLRNAILLARKRGLYLLVCRMRGQLRDLGGMRRMLAARLRRRRALRLRATALEVFRVRLWSRAALTCLF